MSVSVAEIRHHVMERSMCRDQCCFDIHTAILATGYGELIDSNDHIFYRVVPTYAVMQRTLGHCCRGDILRKYV